MLIGLLTGGGLGPWSVGGLIFVVVAMGLAMGFGLGLLDVTALSDLPGEAGPAAVLSRDRRAALTLIVGYMFAFGFGFGGVGWATSGVRGVPTGGDARWESLGGGLVLGLLAGLAVGLAASRSRTAWPDYVLARSWLAWRRLLPRQLMAFLADAHERGVLRQVGSVYQFRHIDLQRRLVGQPSRSLLQPSGVAGKGVPEARTPDALT